MSRDVCNTHRLAGGPGGRSVRVKSAGGVSEGTASGFGPPGSESDTVSKEEQEDRGG